MFSIILDIWRQIASMKPAFISKTPHFNFITVHCKPYPSTLSESASYELTSFSRRHLDHWNGNLRVDMRVSKRRNRLHRCAVPREWCRHPERAQHCQHQRAEYLATGCLLSDTYGYKSNHDQFLRRFSKVILV